METIKCINLTTNEKIKIIKMLCERQEGKTPIMNMKELKYAINFILEENTAMEIEGDTFWMPVSPATRIGFAVKLLGDTP